MSVIILDEKELLKREKEYVNQLKGGEHSDQELFGMAISGGGIRSASFALGVLQALNNRGLIKKLDYMSTVSGGGYIGSCLSWFLNKIYHAEESKLAYSSLGEKGRGVRSSEENDVLSYLRQHGKYLTPGDGLDIISFLGVILRSMFLGASVYFPLIIASFYVLIKMKLISPANEAFARNFSSWQAFSTPSPHSLLAISYYLLGLLAIFAIGYSFGTVLLGGKSFKLYKLRTMYQRISGWILKIFILFFVVGTIPIVASFMSEWVAALTSGSISLLGAIGAVLKLRNDQNRTGGNTSKIKEYLPVVASLLLIYGLLIGGYQVANSIYPWLVLVLVIVSGLIGYFVNLNYVSLHRVYRDRLMEMFLPGKDAIKNGEWDLAKEANGKRLDEFMIKAATKKFIGPFHIINTNLIQIDAAEAKFRGRGGDSFILTPYFCGSNATGWCPTTHFNGGTMTLATAMAISGAAVNSHAGPDGHGATKSWLVSFLMSFLNLELGYWAQNPRRNPVIKKFSSPNYFSPGFLKGLLGIGFNEDSNFIELSDGGHFENLALYELIRRRVKTIIVSDGGADLDFDFSDLANAVEKVRVDFGVQIDFSETDKPISDLLPKSASEKSLYTDKYNLAKSGYATGIIIYPEDKKAKMPAMEGKIYYIKTTLTGNLPEDIYGYKSANPAFPDQSTSDQFFDEAQFEAYRELGYQLAKRMLAENKQLANIR